MENLNITIGQNIVKYRKACNLTQTQLGEKLNFTDKSVSKWEHGDSLPDICVFVKMSEIFGVSLNDLVTKNIEKIVEPKHIKIANHFLITLLSVGLIWLIATIVFVAFLVFFQNLNNKWLCFVYAVPTCLIVGLIFSVLWGKLWVQFLIASLLMWTIAVSICLSCNIWYLLYIAIPLQVLIVLWYLLMMNKLKNKSV